MQVDEQILILRDLQKSKLGTGESIYIESLANKLELSFSTVQSHLEHLGIRIHKHGRWPAITVPDTCVLDEKLAALGIDTSLLKPFAARFNGFFHEVEAFDTAQECAGGQFRFAVRWKHHVPSPTVCCHDLNDSARDHVRPWCPLMLCSHWASCRWQRSSALPFLIPTQCNDLFLLIVFTSMMAAKSSSLFSQTVHDLICCALTSWMIFLGVSLNDLLHHFGLAEYDGAALLAKADNGIPPNRKNSTELLKGQRL